ncbi:MAG: NAD(P)H-hydrate epimerase [Tissierellia bacterium]|nr:NAD(P)H-hydrate epimerase [Tissierellia bacterium]
MITREEMQAIDRSAIEDLEIPSIVLMENAAINTFYNMPKDEDNYLILAGVGNNGGDGLALGRQLLNNNKKVSFLITGDITKSSTDFLCNLKILQKMNVKIDIYKNVKDLKSHIDKSSVVIDSIFGTGLIRPLSEKYIGIVKAVNESGKKVYSIDIPTGLDANTGIPLGGSIKANRTFTMHEVKIGLDKGREYVGEVTVCSIGIHRNYKK